MKKTILASLMLAAFTMTATTALAAGPKVSPKKAKAVVTAKAVKKAAVKKASCCKPGAACCTGTGCCAKA